MKSAERRRRRGGRRGKCEEKLSQEFLCQVCGEPPLVSLVQRYYIDAGAGARAWARARAEGGKCLEKLNPVEASCAN